MTSRTAVTTDCGQSPLATEVKLAANLELPSLAGNGNQFISDPLGGGNEARCTPADVALMHKYYAMWDGDRPMTVRTGNGLQPPSLHRQSSAVMPSFPVTTEIRRDGSYGYMVPPPAAVHPTSSPPHSLHHQTPYGLTPETPTPPLPVSAGKLPMHSPPEMQQFTRCTSGYLSDFGPYGYLPSDAMIDSVGGGGGSVYGYRRGAMAPTADDDPKSSAFPLHPGPTMRHGGSGSGSAADLYQWVREQQNMSLSGLGHRQQQGR
jgi:hypothetical protein